MGRDLPLSARRTVPSSPREAVALAARSALTVVSHRLSQLCVIGRVGHMCMNIWSILFSSPAFSKGCLQGITFETIGTGPPGPTATGRAGGPLEDRS